VTGIDVLGASSAFDPKYNILWLESATNSSIVYLGFDVRNGSVVYTVNDTISLETLAYDPVTGNNV
jgi:hypothetical protein